MKNPWKNLTKERNHFTSASVHSEFWARLSRVTSRARVCLHLFPRCVLLLLLPPWWVVWYFGNEIECDQDKNYDSLQVTHKASPVTPINYWRNCTEWVRWPCYMEWHLIRWWPLRRIFARFSEQLLKDLRKSWQVFNDRSLLGRCFRGFVLPVFEYCSAVRYSVADTYLKLLWSCCQWFPVSNWGCAWMWHCSSSICGSTVFAV